MEDVQTTTKREFDLLQSLSTAQTQVGIQDKSRNDFLEESNIEVTKSMQREETWWTKVSFTRNPTDYRSDAH